ncbi:MAG: HDOD domain-containing protein [Deltaproteobacteria bacterium]|nr:HDOD domain-containing protein [Deltaproteobacteria bacterium]
MGIINVAELKPEMVLAEDLRNLDGRFVLAKGTKLTKKHLRILRMWGVIEANIRRVSRKDVEENTIAQLDPAVIEEVKNLTGERFQHADLEHPPVRELYRLCCLRRARGRSGITLRENLGPHDTAKKQIDSNRLSNDGATTIDPHELIRNDIKLPSLPTIYLQISEAINRPNSSARDIAKVISKDTSLSARLLKIVNSTFYGFPSKIDTLSRAVTIIGTMQLSTLALGMNIIRVFKRIPSHLIDMKSFWEHSLACGINARIIAGYKKIQNTERLFVAGLLHDIGRLLLYSNAPLHAKNALLSAKYGNTLLYKAEYEIMGFDHSKIGGLLLKKWKLPISLENSVRHHHSPHRSKDPLEPAIVHLADIMTNALARGSSGERFVPPLSPDAWECIGLSSNILSSTIRQTDRQIEEIIQLLF